MYIINTQFYLKIYKHSINVFSKIIWPYNSHEYLLIAPSNLLDFSEVKPPSPSSYLLHKNHIASENI